MTIFVELFFYPSESRAGSFSEQALRFSGS